MTEASMISRDCSFEHLASSLSMDNRDVDKSFV